MAALYLGVAAVVPPFDDEIYYWCWAQQLQLSYFDHAPMVGWMIRLSTELFGDSVMAFRLPAVISMAVVGTMLWSRTKPSWLFGFAFVTPLFFAGGAIVTPDTPLLLAWVLYLDWTIRAQERLARGRMSAGYWLVGGLLLGFGALSKYTMILAVPTGFAAWLMCGRSWRDWLPGYVGHGIIAGIVAMPVFVFNYWYDFIPLQFQWSHANAKTSTAGLSTFAEFTGVQILLMGTLPIWMLPWVVSHRRVLAQSPQLRVSMAFYALPMLFFLGKSLRGHLEGNWGLISYLGFWPIFGVWWSQWVGESTTRRRWAAASFLIPAMALLVGIIHLIQPLGVVAPARDRITRQAGRIESTARMATMLRQAEYRLPLFCTNYQWTALMRYQGMDARQLEGATRPSHFTRIPQHLHDVPEALVLVEGPVNESKARSLGFEGIVCEVPILVRGEQTGLLQLLRYVRPNSSPEKCLTAAARNRTMRVGTSSVDQAPE
jgi:4-amino-4-deoxy-L-arabinose transferase-like glycosyltransferase